MVGLGTEYTHSEYPTLPQGAHICEREHGPERGPKSHLQLGTEALLAEHCSSRDTMPPFPLPVASKGIPRRGALFPFAQQAVWPGAQRRRASSQEVQHVLVMHLCRVMVSIAFPPASFH